MNTDMYIPTKELEKPIRQALAASTKGKIAITKANVSILKAAKNILTNKDDVNRCNNSIRSLLFDIKGCL